MHNLERLVFLLFGMILVRLNTTQPDHVRRLLSTNIFTSGSARLGLRHHWQGCDGQRVLFYFLDHELTVVLYRTLSAQVASHVDILRPR